jgi:hypothetical protein
MLPHAYLILVDARRNEKGYYLLTESSVEPLKLAGLLLYFDGDANE